MPRLPSFLNFLSFSLLSCFFSKFFLLFFYISHLAYQCFLFLFSLLSYLSLFFFYFFLFPFSLFSLSVLFFNYSLSLLLLLSLSPHLLFIPSFSLPFAFFLSVPFTYTLSLSLLCFSLLASQLGLTASLQRGKTIPNINMTLNHLITRLQPWRFGRCRVPLLCHCSQVHSHQNW